MLRANKLIRPDNALKKIIPSYLQNDRMICNVYNKITRTNGDIILLKSCISSSGEITNVEDIKGIAFSRPC